MLILFQSDHKKLHKTSSTSFRNLFPPKAVSEPDPATGLFNPFPTFSYTGRLRPVYPLSSKRKVPDSIPHPDYAGNGIPRSEQMAGRNRIAILSKVEQEGMRKVCRLAREVLDLAAKEVRPGVTTDHIDEVVHKACLERNVGECMEDSGVDKLTYPVLPVTSKLRQLSQISLHITQRGHLSWHP